IIEIEFDGDALLDVLVSEARRIASQRPWPHVLNGECETVGLRGGKLELECCGEGLDIDRRAPEYATRLVQPAVSQLQPGIVDGQGASVQRQPCSGRKAIRKINRRAATLNDIRRADHNAVPEAWIDGNCVDGLG